MKMFVTVSNWFVLNEKDTFILRTGTIRCVLRASMNRVLRVFI